MTHLTITSGFTKYCQEPEVSRESGAEATGESGAEAVVTSVPKFPENQVPKFVQFCTLQEITEFLQQLVSIPSINSEQAISTNIAEKPTAFRFQLHLIGDPEHRSVIYHQQAATATKIIWLQSYLDTDPVGDRSQWQHGSFAGTIVSDRICGRGVADSKAAIAPFI